jgi:hypothetical protein
VEQVNPRTREKALVTPVDPDAGQQIPGGFFFLRQSQLKCVGWNQLSKRVNSMAWTSVILLGVWLQRLEPYLSLVAALLSVCILFGCAAASWLAPSERTDRLFHREVM